MTQFDAILPAGGRIDSEFARQVGTDRKALIEFQGETILARAIRALKDTGRIDRIVLIGPEEVTHSPSAEGATLRVPERSSGPENIMAGLSALETPGSSQNNVLVVTTDLPFLSAAALDHVLERFRAGLDILVPVCTQSVYQAMFPGSTSTFIPLKDNGYTAGGVYVMDPDALRRAMPMINRLFDNRKSKLGMAKLLGPTLLAKFLTKTLTIDDVERKAMSLLKLKGEAMRDAPPELAYDIDYLDDYEYAIQHLKKA